MIRAPAFWWRSDTTTPARLLQPIAAVVGVLAARRMARPGARAAAPVVCVGNAVAGGAGKTPTALALAAMLTGMGRRPAFLTRGYGGRLRGPVLVDPARHRAAEVGDEPLLLARRAATIVAADRPAGARLAVAAGADVLVMDDGFQNPSLTKDLSLLAIDARRGFGNGRTLPAGPLRAPVEAQLARASAVVLIGAGAAGEHAAEAAARSGVAVLRARLVPDPAVAAAFAGRRILAFAGIADPAKFRTTLNEAGVDVVDLAAFADHHVFTAADARRLVARARSDDLALVTTEKDLVRLQGRTETDLAALGERARALPVTLVFEDPQRVRDLLARVL